MIPAALASDRMAVRLYRPAYFGPNVNELIRKNEVLAFVASDAAPETIWLVRMPESITVPELLSHEGLHVVLGRVEGLEAMRALDRIATPENYLRNGGWRGGV